MNNQDVRWLQRLDNFTRALTRLNAALALTVQRPLSDLEQQGLIQAFEFTHELAWNVMKDYFEYQGESAKISGSRDATRLAFQRNLIVDGESWMEMLESRNQTSHTYNQEVAELITERIKNRYGALFNDFHQTMQNFK